MAMQAPPTSQPGATASAPATEMKYEIYIPGYLGAKIFMIFFGFLVFSLSLTKFIPVFRHMLFGETAQAEVVRVVRQSLSGEEEILKNDIEIKAITEKEKRDRNHIFWNEFRFVTKDGKTVEFRAPVGSYLKPHHPILDADGMPTTVRVWYDPGDPKSVTLPLELSTWFLPGALGFFGLLTMFVGAVLAYYANKPIEMPILGKHHKEAK